MLSKKRIYLLLVIFTINVTLYIADMLIDLPRAVEIASSTLLLILSVIYALILFTALKK